ncbi:MAG: methyl-accepting chemotaxis protein [Opitutus sp.]
MPSAQLHRFTRRSGSSSKVLDVENGSTGSGLASVSAIELNRIADASVSLACLGPNLARLAAEVELQAQTQARRAETVAAAMDALARDLQTSVTELRSSSNQMHDALRTVERIADYTRLLSINASIEAARAGEQGKAFAVVVDEVKRLADSSGQNTKLIEQRIDEIDGSVARVAAVTLDEANPTFDTSRSRRTVGAVTQEIRGMAESAGKQLSSAESVHAMGDEINGLTESLLLAVGRFRFGAHARAQSAVEQLASALVVVVDQPREAEASIEAFLNEHAYFELGYLTNANGCQVTANLVSRNGTVTRDAAGLKRDWSERPWYRAALATSGACSTDIYRSSATRDFCFTVATALRDAEGNVNGVFGCDVNFQRMLGDGKRN